MSGWIRRDIFLKIEALNEYSPLAPVLCSRGYGRDCMFGEGHEWGRLSNEEITGATLDARVFREYLDPDYTQPNTRKLVEADVNEPPWHRRVPGAVLYAEPGERLYIHVLNADTECHSFHLHGLKYGVDSDGAWPFGVQASSGARSDEIRPGQRWTYVFDATRETIGAWAFHSHVRHVQRAINRGLFGGLIVRDPERRCVDHEVPLFFHLLEGAGNVCQFQSPRLDNGDTFEATVGNTPGVCKYFCQIHGVTMAGSIVVDPAGAAHADVEIFDNFFKEASVTVRPGGTVKWTHRGARSHIVYASGGGAATFAMNGRAYVGNTPTIEVASGERIRWYVFNLDLGAVWHNFHPHAVRWQLPAPEGGASDVHALSPAESFVADSVAPLAIRLPCALEALQCEPPADACRVRVKGDFLVHCHVEDHMMAGLAGLLRAHQYIWISPSVVKQLPFELPLDDGSNECPPVDVFRCQPRPKPPRALEPPVPTHVEHDEAPQPEPEPHAADAGHDHGGGSVVIDSTAAPAAALALADARVKGIWEVLPCESPVRIVHAALLHTGKVLFFSGSGDDELYTAGLGSAVWDYQGGEFHVPVTPMDFFCSGQSFLPDGKLLVAGGTKDYAFTAASHAFFFDPILEEWIRVADMAFGRWYPMLVTLGDGRILAVSGGPNRSEVFTWHGGWATLSPTLDPPWALYPSLTLLRDGKLFYSGEHTFGGGPDPGRLDLATNVLTPVALPPGFDLGARDQGGTVLLAPAQAQRVMLIGGGGVSTTATIDLSVTPSHYVMTAPMHNPRIHMNAVLLPDRTVFVSGGNRVNEDVATATLESEIYDPVSDTWTRAAKAQVPRLYHSVALLLPDGRVIAAGSNTQRRDNELRLELFHPPYLFKGHRPFISNAPAQVSYGRTFEIHTPQAEHIRWAELIRPMATTHSSDSEQRVVDLPIERREFCKLHVRVPANPNLAPPGHYMLFIVDDRGVPSVAAWVHLERDGRLSKIRSIKIHPAIGVARLGNSAHEFFVGSELPGAPPTPAGGFKDATGAVKRKAARFRVFGFDDHGKLVQELTAEDAQITWSVHLVNKKAAAPRFEGLDRNTSLRNAHVKDRKQLVIDGGARSVGRPGAVAHFDGGSFFGTKVALGELRVEDSGRLLVLGGHGASHAHANEPLQEFANNDGWCDDTSDGPVQAKVRLHGFTETTEAAPAWVVVAPPDFAPAVAPIKTMYDVLTQVAIDRLGVKRATRPSFRDDIYPILERVMRLGWVSGLSAGNHSLLNAVVPPPGDPKVRAHILSHVRNPAGGGGDMPRIWSDTESRGDALTPLQYWALERWKDGDFIDDWSGAPVPESNITPAGLDRAELEACVGGPFFPGIEFTWYARDVYAFSEPYRLDPTQLSPGELTQHMAVPWQADFYDCQAYAEYAWWPSQRPDDVFPADGGPQRSWTGTRVNSHADMVKHWHELGFVVEEDGRLVEKERAR